MNLRKLDEHNESVEFGRTDLFTNITDKGSAAAARNNPIDNIKCKSWNTLP